MRQLLLHLLPSPPVFSVAGRRRGVSHLHAISPSGSYEPPLTNVFTMQWFLTMFATCLPTSIVLKIWDSVFFEGSEVLFRVALAIWERLGE